MRLEDEVEGNIVIRRLNKANSYQGSSNRVFCYIAGVKCKVIKVKRSQSNLWLVWKQTTIVHVYVAAGRHLDLTLSTVSDGFLLGGQTQQQL